MVCELGMIMIKRGEIYLVNLNPIKGREQAGRRPVLVISSDAINKQPLVVSVVVGTDAQKVPKDYPLCLPPHQLISYFALLPTSLTAHSS